jgi:hypothetical protein
MKYPEFDLFSAKNAYFAQSYPYFDALPIALYDMTSIFEILHH